MLRMLLLTCAVVFGTTLGSFVWAQEKVDESLLPEGKDAREVVGRIQQQLFQKGPAGIELFEKQKKEFYKKFADDPGRWQLKLLEARVLQMTGEQLGGGGRTSKEILKEINEGKDVPEEIKTDVSAMSVLAMAPDVAAGKTKFADMLAAAEQHLAHYPKARTNRGLVHAVVEAASKDADAEKHLVALGESKNSDIAALAETKLKVVRVRKELMSKPLELSFKAVDGREVDFAKMRGKVVLVDFWATWCGPCMAEVPNVVSAYKKLNDKGFEIVGISLDDDEGKLKQVVADKEMSWPHHFDGKGWQNELASKYGVNSIPEMWLVDKKGMVKTYTRDKNLTEEVEKLLAE
jgi:thiol-disulfide isomerase/thioredoxin